MAGRGRPKIIELELTIENKQAILDYINQGYDLKETAKALKTSIAQVRGVYNRYIKEAKQVIANMMFNMGRTRLSKFKKHNTALQSGDWKTAAAEGRDSRWYKQVTNRAERLMSRLEEI